MTTQTVKQIANKFRMAAILRDGMKPSRKKWSKTVTLVPIPDAPETFLEMQKRTGRKFNGAIAGKF